MLPLVLCVLAFWLTIFALFFWESGSSLLDFVLGQREPLPERLGVWLEVPRVAGEPLLREERFLLEGDRLIRQTRYRDESGAIVRVDPEIEVTRKRSRTPHA